MIIVDTKKGTVNVYENGEIKTIELVGNFNTKKDFKKLLKEHGIQCKVSEINFDYGTVGLHTEMRNTYNY